MHLSSQTRFRRTMVCIAISLVGTPIAAWSQSLTLARAPATLAYKPPAPNVIVSVDDSGSMGANGMATLRAALLDTFTVANVPDGAIRLGWQSLTGCFNIPSGGDCANRNEVRVLDAVKRSQFETWVATLKVNGSTPSHRMLFNAGEYFKKTPSANSPWASVPGPAGVGVQEPMLACRRSYNLFMTDGGWNSTGGWSNANPGAESGIANADGTMKPLADGITYDPASNQTHVYSDSFGSAALPTFADLAFNYWANDLQITMPNSVPKRLTKVGDETITSPSGASTLIQEYWNPKNDPATWQHMTTYTVGFNNAANWGNFPNGPALATPVYGTTTWSGGDYERLILGETGWTNPITPVGDAETKRMPELWHAAINSRGKFVPAPTAESLAPAFKSILNDIVTDNSTPITSLAATAGSLRQESAVYAAEYGAGDWTGGITAYPVAVATGAVSSTGLWGMLPPVGSLPAKAKSTASLMDDSAFSPVNRVVLSAQAVTAGAEPTGFSWTWLNLNTTRQLQLNSLGSVVDTRGPTRLNYIRGVRTLEVGQPSGVFRERKSRQGDIVNSKLWYTDAVPDAGYTADAYGTFRSSNASRRATFYVGGNDGMLHGFDALTGIEKIAYVPAGVHSKLSALTQPGYVHDYFVDGSPFSADVYVGSSWKTYLAGFPGAGARGYFILDVTDPSATGFSAGNAANVVVMDKTETPDADVGFITAEPAKDQVNSKLATQLTKMNDGRWALVMGNGVNSPNGKAVLLIQYLDGAKELKKISAGTSTANGLSAPRLVDLNGDRKPDVAYAGDQQGNLWKFDLSSGTASNWKVSFAGAPLYTAKDPSGVVQLISSTPGWLFHPNGGLMVTFGTGRNLTDADPNSAQVQTLYGIYDSTTYTLAGTSPVVIDGTSNAVSGNRTALVQQTVSATSTAVSEAGETLFTVSSNTVPYTGANAKKGWYLNLPVNRERVLRDVQYREGRLFSFPSVVPIVGNDTNTETCNPNTKTAESYLTTLDVINGSAPGYSIYAYSTTVTSPNQTNVESRQSDVTGGNSVFQRGVDGASADDVCITTPGQVCDNFKRQAARQLRPTWRQAQ